MPEISDQTLPDPRTMHCQTDPMTCRGESYCSCQCARCKTAYEAGAAFYAKDLAEAALKVEIRAAAKRAEDVMAAKERARIVDRLRARATSEEVNAERCRVAGDPRMREMYEKAASVLREECDRLESGV